MTKPTKMSHQKTMSARDIMKLGGVDPDALFKVGPFPAEMRMRPDGSPIAEPQDSDAAWLREAANHQDRLWDEDRDRLHSIAARLEAPCPSCGGLNISCPDGCGRDPETGELNGTRLEAPNLDALVEALSFYASKRSYGTRRVSHGVKYSDVDIDGGERARAAIHEKKG